MKIVAYDDDSLTVEMSRKDEFSVSLDVMLTVGAGYSSLDSEVISLSTVEMAAVIKEWVALSKSMRKSGDLDENEIKIITYDDDMVTMKIRRRPHFFHLLHIMRSASADYNSLDFGRLKVSEEEMAVIVKKWIAASGRSLQIWKAGDGFFALYITQKQEIIWEATEPVQAEEIMKKLSKLGAHPIDVLDALHEADPKMRPLDKSKK